MKRMISILLAAALLSTSALSTSALAGTPLMGGWSVTEDSTLTSEALAAYEKATEGLLGVDYEPVDLLATQLVAGTNYCILCRGKVVHPDAGPEYMLMYIYEDLQGNAQILEIKEIEFGLSPEEDGEDGADLADDDVSEDASDDVAAEDDGAAAAADDYAAMVQEAQDLIREAMQAQAEKYPEMMPEAYVNIKNTRIIRIAEDPVMEQANNKPAEELKGVDCIVEFMMLTNYYGDSYPLNAGVYDTVTVYRNGSMELNQSNPLNMLRAKYYLSDYSGVIEEIIDLGSAFNGEL